MATIRDCFLVDFSAHISLEIIYCSRLKHIQDQFKKYKWCYIQEPPNIIDKAIYTSDIIMDLKKTGSQFRKMYISPFLKLIVVG